MTARFIEHVIFSRRAKRRVIYISILVARALTADKAARARGGATVGQVSDTQLRLAGSHMLSDLRAVYRDFTIHVAPDRPGSPDVLVEPGSPDSWAIEYHFEPALKLATGSRPVICQGEHDNETGAGRDVRSLGGRDLRSAHYQCRAEGLDNLALVYPDDSRIQVAHARGLDLILGDGTDNWTGELLLSASFEMKLQLDRDIVQNTSHTVAHEVGHCLGLADTPNHEGTRLMGGRGRQGLLEADRLWIHRATDSGLLVRMAEGTTWGSQPPLSFASP